jgi:hypothetical protein
LGSNPNLKSGASCRCLAFLFKPIWLKPPGLFLFLKQQDVCCELGFYEKSGLIGKLFG